MALTTAISSRLTSELNMPMAVDYEKSLVPEAMATL